MSRPDGVRCELCCYFEGMWPHPSSPEVMEGWCWRYPPEMMPGADVNFPDGPDVHAVCRRTHGGLGCGEFRSEWPVGARCFNCGSPATVGVCASCAEVS